MLSKSALKLKTLTLPADSVPPVGMVNKNENETGHTSMAHRKDARDIPALIQTPLTEHRVAVVVTNPMYVNLISETKKLTCVLVLCHRSLASNSRSHRLVLCPRQQQQKWSRTKRTAPVLRRQIILRILTYPREHPKQARRLENANKVPGNPTLQRRCRQPSGIWQSCVGAWYSL